MEGIFVALSGAMAQERRLDVVTNNLANLKTVGFKKQFPIFHSRRPEINIENMNLVNPDIAGSPIPTLNNDLTYSQITSTFTDFSAGTFRQTGSKVDFALKGDGFFVVQNEFGDKFYTRKGNFVVNSDNELKTADGKMVLRQGSDNPIKLSGDFAVEKDGTIVADGQTIAQLRVVTFNKPFPLEPVGKTEYKLVLPDIEPLEAENTEVLHGYLEESNVDAIGEMIEMIKIQRAYSAYQKVIQTEEDLLARRLSLALA